MLDQWEEPRHDGIRNHTRHTTNERIDRQTHAALDHAGNSRERIAARLADLDHEWDVDRALMLNFALLGGITATMALRNAYRHRRLGGWGALFIIQMSFLAHHAIRHWCPPLPVFRRAGFRTAKEIAAERMVLRARLDNMGV